MANRHRAIRKQLFLTDGELAIINQKMAQAGIANFSQYARNMLVEGQIIKRDFGDVKALARELAEISRDINKTARIASETRSIYEQDIKDLQRAYGTVRSKVSERLVRMIREREGA